MKKTISFLLIALLGLAVVSPAIAADAEYTTREAWRTGVVTAIFDNAVAFVGNITVATNATVAGTTIVNAIDTTGAADIDYGSADVTDHTFVSDGGTTIIDGTITMGAAALLDATGAVDMDYGSADITDHTFTSDGGTVILDGIGTFSDDVTCDKIIFTDAATAAPTNTASQGFTITVNGTNYVIALYPN